MKIKSIIEPNNTKKTPKNNTTFDSIIPEGIGLNLVRFIKLSVLASKKWFNAPDPEETKLEPINVINSLK